MHRRGVANDVWRNPFGFQRGAGWQGSLYSLLEDVGGPVGGQPSAPSTAIESVLTGELELLANLTFALRGFGRG